MRGQGVKLIGYVPNGYMPLELIHACDSVPIPLFYGGNYAQVEESSAYLARFLDTFSRAQIGYRFSNSEDLYQMLDLLIVPVTDNHIRAIADSWDFYTDVDVFRLGVPHAKTEHGLTYYLEGLELVKKKLENLSETPITNQRLADEIASYNRRKSLLREISLLRKSNPPALSGSQFIRLNHSCHLVDKSFVLQILEQLSYEIKKSNDRPAIGPRIMLTGSTLAFGDSKVIDLIEQAGASIVMEEFCEGIESYWEDVETGGSLLDALADCYFTKKIPGAFFRGAARERFARILKLAGDFTIDGMVYYSLMYRDAYDVEAYLFGRAMKNRRLPFIKVTSDYDASETGALKTRIEAFIEMISYGG
ncbi:2-hydroxyacyl-CoA dehydratase subunit D [Thermodesulfobacteriota bacterium]